LLQVVGNTADVILVAVGHHHAFDFVAVLPHVAHVRQDNVDAVHLLAGKTDAPIEQKHFLAAFKDASVFADFVQPAQRDDVEGRGCIALLATH